MLMVWEGHVVGYGGVNGYGEVGVVMVLVVE